MNLFYSISVIMNSTTHHSMDQDTMKVLSSLIIKTGTIPLKYHFTVISNLSELTKRLFKTLTIVMMYMVLMITNPSVVVVPNRFLLLFSMP